MATGDSQTSAKLVSFLSRSLLEEQVPWEAHLKPFYHLYSSIEYVSAQDFNMVHAHLSSASDLYLMPLLSKLGIPHLTTLHSPFPFDGIPSGWKGDADTYYMKWADAVPMVTISESARRQAKYPLNIVGIVHNGLTINDFPWPNGPREDFFLWIGRFSPDKGVHLAIEAAKRANVPLVLAGTKDLYEERSMRYFREVIEPQFDGQLIRYVGPVGMQQKLDLLGRAKGFLNPIVWEEFFGMVMLEAMVTGCSIISFARGAARELIVDGETGFLVNTVDEMVQRMSCIDQLDRRKSRAHVVEHFSAYTMACRYNAIYDHLITDAAGESPQENGRERECELR
jgi:glycosyltransferase involved in cell wall biosynthesis